MINLFIFLVAQVNDTIQEEVAISGEDLGITILIVIILYLLISFITWLLNRLLKKNPNWCDDCLDLGWMPMMHFGCLFCRLGQFFRPSTWKSYMKNHTQKILEKTNKKRIEFEEKIREKTKYLRDL